jgi:hypothetical protein
MQETQCAGGIYSVRGVNRGYAQVVALDEHFALQSWHGAVPVKLRQARPQTPPQRYRGDERQQHNGAKQ